MHNVPPIYPTAHWKRLASESGLLASFGQPNSIKYRNTNTEGFVILTEETAKAIGAFLADKKVIEVFCGTGFLAHHLRQASGLSRKNYKAYDNYSEGYPSTRVQRAKYKGVTVKNAFMAPIQSADVVIMSWPDYNVNNAARIVKKMRPGQYLLFEGEGPGGCTADDDFFDILEEQFKLLPFWTRKFNEHHVQYAGMHDYWSLYRRNWD